MTRDRGTGEQVLTTQTTEITQWLQIPTSRKSF
jgi:hypothetical protein